MKAQVVTGSKQEIAEMVARLEGDVREAIVFVDEPSSPSGEQDIFAEMEPYTVRADGADYSRESLYSRMDGE